MPTVRRSPARPLVVQAGAGLVGVLVLLTALTFTVGLGRSGWLVGVGYGIALAGTLVRAVWRSGRERLGPADAVTLTRAVLVGGVTALVAESFSGPVPVPVMVALATVALALDAVDGRVARRTGTVTAVGARFDMEVDAFLVLVLALYDVRLLGSWVLLIGLARYLFVAAGWLLPWLGEPTPPRLWGKVVAATQGVVLTVVMAGGLPRPIVTVAALAALVLLAESFGRQVRWLHRHARPAHVSPAARSAARRILAAAATVPAVALVWFALVAPSDPTRMTPGAFARIPLEALVVLTLIVLLPPRPGRVVAVLCGTVLGVLTVVKVLDIGFRSALNRPFDLLADWTYTASFVELLDRSVGRAAAAGIAIGIAVAIVVLLVVTPLTVRRLTRLACRDRAVTYRFIAAFAAIWLVAATVGLQVVPGASVSAAETAALVYQEVAVVRAGLADREVFREQLGQPVTQVDPMLAGLRGKDVVIAFVESYGRVAIEDPQISPGVDAVLDNGTRQLTAAGFTSESAFLTSPTFGGLSWLAHSTLQSGLWVDSQQRYEQLVAGDRPTLTSVFGQAGWRTVLDVPANQRDWPEATTFYRADEVHDARTVGYRGPPFAFGTAPDQYTLAHFQRTELAPDSRTPVMAEIDLATSHTPWVPVPELVDWADIGDGTVFDGVPEQSPMADEVLADQTAARAAYGATIEYSLSTLISFALTYGDDGLVLVVVGDHQPAPIISGDGAGHDVPITVIGKDPAVFSAIASWGWQPGLNPDPQAPVWRMDAFHDRFLDAFSG
jgi:phosphatidylglycerophosphate synthase